MGIGHKIKEFRTKTGLTQKDLADELHVTYQAVSRWENDDAEPSFDTIKEMCRIFNCSTDELFDMEKSIDSQTQEDDVHVIERVIVQESKPVLGVCEHCNKPIFEADDINRVDETHIVRSGKSSHSETRQKVLCNDCNKKRLLKEKEEADQKQKALKGMLKKRRIHSFVWPSIIALTLIIIGIVLLANGETPVGIALLVSGAPAFTFVATMILQNNFIADLWEEVASWGFVRMPGIIFEFSIDGFIFLIVLKILFFLLGMTLSILAAVFATALAMFLSIFVYPFALAKNIRGKDTE